MKQKKKKTKGLGNAPAAAKSNKKKWVFLSIGLLGTGALSYFGWRWWQNNRATNLNVYPADSGSNATIAPPSTVSTYSPGRPNYSTTQTANDSFPLKNGSRGENVRLLQDSIVTQYGLKIGVDGVFGSETAGALKKLNFPVSIDQTTFNVITKPKSLDAAGTAQKLYNAMTGKDFNAALALLKMLKSTADYSAVSTNLSENYRIGGVHQTLVNAMLNTYTSETQKQQIRLAFAAMGLKYDGDKWSLSGLGGMGLLVTIKPTRIWKDPQTSVAVPVKMVLGRPVATRGHFTLFENEDNFYLVQTAHVGKYKQK